MKILNLGSCCVDHVYHVPYFVAPGETLLCSNYTIHPGGKGLNQSIAMARAGIEVCHAGKIGPDGVWLKDLLDETGVNTEQLIISTQPTGHASIQVSDSGENAIVLFGGANRTITVPELETMMADFKEGDLVLFQNETSELAAAMGIARRKGLGIIFNAAPMGEDVLRLPLDAVELLIVNEIEGAALTGKQVAEDILNDLINSFPDLKVVITLGKEGARYADQNTRLSASSPRVATVDSTGAGDTFTGYFIAAYSQGQSIEEALTLGCNAAALSVTQSGAASSIPTKQELTTFLLNNAP